MGKVLGQRRIGYQRMSNGDLGSVIEEQRSDGTFYFVSYQDKNGFTVPTIPTRDRPRIDIPQERHDES